MNTPKNLLIIRTDRIGDVTLTLPLAAIVKKHYPECKVSFLLTEYTKTLAANNPYIDEVLILRTENKKVSLVKNLSVLERHHFDSCIVVSPSFIIALIVFLSEIKLRIGTGYRWYSFFFNNKIFTHRKFAEKHELEFNIDMLKPLGINYTPVKGELDFSIKADDVSCIEIESLFVEEKINPQKPIIIVHPGSGGSSVDYPASKFKELISLMAEIPGAQVIISGSEQESELCSRIAVPGKTKNFAGKLSLPRLIALIEKSHIFIANSTGPLHIAAALGKYVIGFYPNLLACSSKRWGPYSDKSYVFTPECECEDCKREQCTSGNCMNSIKVTDVFGRVQEICQILENNGEINE